MRPPALCGSNWRPLARPRALRGSIIPRSSRTPTPAVAALAAHTTATNAAAIRLLIVHPTLRRGIFNVFSPRCPAIRLLRAITRRNIYRLSCTGTGHLLGVYAWFQVNRERRGLPRLDHDGLLIHAIALDGKVVWHSPIVPDQEGNRPCVHLQRIKRNSEACRARIRPDSLASRCLRCAGSRDASRKCHPSSDTLSRHPPQAPSGDLDWR